MPQSNDNDNKSDGDDDDFLNSDLDDDMYKTPRTKKSRVVDSNNKKNINSKVTKGTINSDNSDANENSILMKGDEEHDNI